MSFQHHQNIEEKKSLIKNLVFMMLADGKIDDNEIEYLSDICKRENIPQKDLEKIISNPQKIKLFIPKTHQEKINHIIQLINMMLSDGNVDENEAKFIVAIGSKFGYDKSKIMMIFNELLKSIKSGDDLDNSIEVLRDSL